MSKDKNDQHTTDLFDNSPMILNLGAIKSALKIGKSGEVNKVEFTITGATNVNDTAMLKTPVWAVAAGEWVCRVCNENFDEVQRIVYQIAAESESNPEDVDKGLESTGLLSVKIGNADVTAVFSCDTVMSDIMRLSETRIVSMIVRWLLSLCEGDTHKAIFYVNEGYMRIVAEQEPAPEPVKFSVVR